MKIIFFIVFAIFLTNHKGYSQNYSENHEKLSRMILSIEQKEEHRKLYFFSSVGIIEVAALGIGYQYSKEISITLKGAGTWIGSSALFLPNGGYGIGIGLHYYKSFSFFNNISVEYVALLSTSLDWKSKIMYGEIDSEPVLKGYYILLNFGRQKITTRGFNFFWDFGFCINIAKHAHDLYLPTIRLGFNYNFI